MLDLGDVTLGLSLVPGLLSEFTGSDLPRPRQPQGVLGELLQGGGLLLSSGGDFPNSSHEPVTWPWAPAVSGSSPGLTLAELLTQRPLELRVAGGRGPAQSMSTQCPQGTPPEPQQWSWQGAWVTESLKTEGSESDWTLVLGLVS